MRPRSAKLPARLPVVIRWFSVDLSRSLEKYRAWLRTYSTYKTGQGVFAGSSYTALDLAWETRRELLYFELTAEWRVGRQ